MSSNVYSSPSFKRILSFRWFYMERQMGRNGNACHQDLTATEPLLQYQVNGFLPHKTSGGLAVNGNKSVLEQAASVSGLPTWKRIVDLGIVFCTFWAWLPLMMIVTCAVKLASPGPSIYRQRRVGYKGREFMIFKFRTMHLNADTRTHENYLAHLMSSDSPMTKLDAADPRLIVGGRFLRATGLDELPQIFNIIRGDMSIVGPRPCTVAEYQHYGRVERHRVNALPGITGYWQVNGKNSTTFREMVAMDRFYVRNMSLRLDLEIILRTAPAILRQVTESPAFGPTRGAFVLPQNDRHSTPAVQK